MLGKSQRAHGADHRWLRVERRAHRCVCHLDRARHAIRCLLESRVSTDCARRSGKSATFRELLSMALIGTMRHLRCAFTLRLFLAMVAVISVGTTACSDLDPVKVESKCDEGAAMIDGNCPQCQTP